MRARSLISCSIALVISCSGNAALHAQAAPPEPPNASPGAPEEPAGYRALVAEALSEYEAGRFEESRSLMLRAHALYPNARTLRGLGMVSFELREYGDSVRKLEQALASSVRPLEGDLRRETEALLVRARTFAGRVALVVTPREARVAVDGVELAPEEAHELILRLGEHLIEVRAAGYLAERRAIRVAGGDQQQLQIALTPVPAAPPEATERARPWYRSPWLWVPVSVVAVAGATLATTFALQDDPAREPPYRGLSGELPLNGPSQ